MVRLSSSRGHCARAFAVLALVAAAACSDDAVSPTAGALDAPSLKKSPLLPGLVSGNALLSGKYRDSSKPNATGRSGSAVLSARAVLDSLGVTHLLVQSASVRDPGTVAGELAKVQIKVWAPDGEALFTQNHQRPTSGGSHEFLLLGVPAGSRIQVQANVRGIDRNRTDVVTVTETAKLDARLGMELVPPPGIAPGRPTVIHAVVNESNGDVGAWSKCVLYVQGVAVDSATVWVDAGDAVSCAFTHTFPGPGTYDVQVALYRDGERVATDEARILVEDPNPSPTWRATVLDRTVTHITRYDLHWWNPNGSHKEYEQGVGESTRGQSISITGTLARATVFPLATVSLALGSDAIGTFQTATWSGLVGIPDLTGTTCVNQLIYEQGGHFSLCSTGVGGLGSTTFGYTRFAGTVTYHSSGFSRTWNALTGTETYFTWNDNPEMYASGGQLRNLGTSVGIQLSITDGFSTFAVNAAVPVSTFDNPLSEIPYTCRDESPYWLDGGVQTICEGRTEREHGKQGTAAG